MPSAVSREKGDALAAQRTEEIRSRRLAKRRGDLCFLAFGHVRHIVQTGPADDPYLCSLHVLARLLGLGIRDPGSGIRDPLGVGIQDLGSGFYLMTCFNSTSTPCAAEG